MSRGATALALAALACTLVAGCSTTPTSGFALLAPPALSEPRPPTPLDRAVVDLAVAAFAGDAERMDVDLARIKELNDDAAIEEREKQGQPPMKGLVPLCEDLRNAALDDPVAYREASKELLDEWWSGLDPALEARLKQAVDDDPLELASERMWDHYESIWASTFNAVVEPVGGSLAAGVAIAPFRLANRLTHYLAGMYSRPAMSLQERQALAHRKLYLEKHPDAADAPEVRKKVEEGERELDEMLAEEYVERARDSLDARRYWVAELQAERALRVRPGDQQAATVAAIAASQLERRAKERARSEQAAAALPEDLAPGALHALTGLAEEEHPSGEGPPLDALLATLLASSKVTPSHPFASPEDARRQEQQRRLLYRVIDEARALQQSDPDGPLADEAEYLLALAQNDLGFESESWTKLGELSEEERTASNMSRHAAALVGDPWQNTWGNFERQKRRAHEKDLGFRLFGAQSFGRRYPELPLGLSYLIELPAIAQALVTAPLRLVFGPWEPRGRDFYEAPAVAGYRYLAREPDGHHTRQVAQWLYDYETSHENWIAALRLYDLQPETDPIQRIALAEKAANQQLAAASRSPRRDWRGSILRDVVRSYPDSDAGHVAGFELRQEIEEIAPQRIRVTRSFLEENPKVAGPHGMALNPALLDGDTHNGELHPMGVTFLGGQVMEFALVAASGDEDDAPVTVRERVDADRLSRSVAQLDETVLMNDQIDELDAVQPDAFRDYYLERARLGLVATPDMRASAESDYVYESLREQYGVVRGRESILPFDLVFQGSLFDMSLGAFPRWRQPRQTPDAFLYK